MKSRERRVLLPARRRFGVLLGLAVVAAGPGGAQSATAQAHHDPSEATAPGEWRMPPMPPGMFMLPGTETLVPGVRPFLPEAPDGFANTPEAVYREVVPMENGDTLDLEATFVRRTVKEYEFIAYGFNGQYPGPLIRVDQGSTIVVRFTNGIDWPSTVHWHGIRIENRFDGVAGVTQELVMPGETFTYEVAFPDAGIYWYHPHHRSEVTQGLGLFGNILVDSPDLEYYGPANRDEVLILDDLLFDGEGLFPYGGDAATHAMMGRFGNVLLVNGKPDYELALNRGEVVRVHLTNASATRTYNLSFSDGTPMKLVASDLSRLEREQWTESVVIAPAERYVIEVRFDEPGARALVNEVRAINHMHGTFYTQIDTLVVVPVSDTPADPDFDGDYRQLRQNQAVSDDIDPFRPLFDEAVDHSLTLQLRVDAEELPLPIVNVMQIDTIYYPPVEWNDAMPDMNWLATTDNFQWFLRDDDTGDENLSIDWSFQRGDVVKLRIFNDPTSLHPMHHPIHLHGQRFLVLEQDGVLRTNLVWKDTTLVPTGSTVVLLVEMSNPGQWMLHCHISEHLGAGMKMVFTVDEVGVGSDP